MDSQKNKYWYELGLKEGYEYRKAILSNLVPSYTHPPSWSDKAQEFYDKGWIDGTRKAIIAFLLERKNNYKIKI